MNKFDEKYDIRFANYDEIDEIMEFIDTHWKKGHILATNRAFFEYEMVIDGHVNFVIAKDRVTGKIQGLHGYVIASKNKDKFDTWGSIWKVIPGSMGLLGLEIVKRLEKDTKTRAFLSIGGNPTTTVPILKIRHFEDVGKMHQFYCVSKKNDYKIAKISHFEPLIKNTKYQVSVTPIGSIIELKKIFDFSQIENTFPYKDEWYINHRYFEHPIFKYQVFGLSEKDRKVQALMFCREQLYDDAKVLRIVDYIGNIKLFSGISDFLESALNDYEYVDFYCYGIDTTPILQAGMIERTDEDTNVIPNYFAPYVAKNIDIWVGTPKGKAAFFKADGDQDRPN